MLLTYAQAAKYLAVSRRTFYRLLPSLTRIDCRAPGRKRAVWRIHQPDLDAWIASRSVAPGKCSPFDG